VIPKVKLGDYKKIKKTAPKVTVDSKEVQKVLENLGKHTATKVDTKQAAKDGDDVIIDFEGKDKEGALVAGASGSDYSLNLGSNTFIPGFEEALIGVKAGDKKDLPLTFPKDYHAKNLAGTKITFAVTVKNVQAVKPPVFDDAFAATIGPFKTLDELKKDIKTQLTEQKMREATNEVKDQILEELVKKSSMTVPEMLVDEQVALLEQDVSQNLAYRGITKTEYIKQQGFKDEAEWKAKELVPQATRRVSVGLVLAEVAENENIQVSPDELQNQIALYKQQYQQSAEQFDQPETQREVASRLLTEKTIDRLYEIATA
jgi:trigger factor